MNASFPHNIFELGQRFGTSEACQQFLFDVCNRQYDPWNTFKSALGLASEVRESNIPAIVSHG